MGRPLRLQRLMLLKLGQQQREVPCGVAVTATSLLLGAGFSGEIQRTCPWGVFLAHPSWEVRRLWVNLEQKGLGLILYRFSLHFPGKRALSARRLFFVGGGSIN